MILFRASIKILAIGVLSASMLFPGCAAPQNPESSLSGSPSASNESISSMSSNAESVSTLPDSSIGTNNTTLDSSHSATLQSAVNNILDDIIHAYVNPFYIHYACRESSDFAGYVIDAISYSGTPIPQLCIETEWLQDGYGHSYYMVHFYSREYDKNNHLLNKKTVNRYIISLPDGLITPMLDQNGNFMKEYNDMIK